MIINDIQLKTIKNKLIRLKCKEHKISIKTEQISIIRKFDKYELSIKEICCEEFQDILNNKFLEYMKIEIEICMENEIKKIFK